MLDLIADKATAAIALAVIVGLWGLKALILVLVAFILLRESSSRPARVPRRQAGQLKVTYLAKWNTMPHMVAILVLLLLPPPRRPPAQRPLGPDRVHDWDGPGILSNGGAPWRSASL